MAKERYDWNEVFDEEVKAKGERKEAGEGIVMK